MIEGGGCLSRVSKKGGLGRDCGEGFEEGVGGGVGRREG